MALLVNKYQTNTPDLEVDSNQAKLTGAVLTVASKDSTVALGSVIGSILFDETLDGYVKEQEELENLSSCLLKIEQTINFLDDFPASYNQVLLKGSLRYFSKAIEVIQTKMDFKRFNESLKYIKEFIGAVGNLLDQLTTEKEILANLNLQFYEDRFDVIEERCVRIDLIPSLDDLTFPHHSE